MRHPLPSEVEQARVRDPNPTSRVTFPPHLATTTEDGCNGVFRLRVRGQWVRCVVSDGEGWEHVSVSVEGSKRCPSWEIMCEIKDLFWNPQEWVVEYHPARTDYVNQHPATLHLWRPTMATLPTPNSIMVGLRPDQMTPSMQAAEDALKKLAGF